MIRALPSHQKTTLRRDRYALGSGHGVGPPYPITPELHIKPYNTISRFCVPVSTTGGPCPEHEIHGPTIEDLDQIFRAIRLLKSYGWTVGCDYELLPPGWILEGLCDR